MYIYIYTHIFKKYTYLIVGVIYMYIYPNWCRFKSDGYTIFSSWTAPKCRISFRFTRNNPRPPSCSYHWSVSIHPNLSLCGLEIHHHYQKLSHHLYGVTKSSKSIMIFWLVVQFHHLKKWWSSSMGRMTSHVLWKLVSSPLKNMSSSVGMMTFPTE